MELWVDLESCRIQPRWKKTLCDMKSLILKMHIKDLSNIDSSRLYKRFWNKHKWINCIWNSWGQTETFIPFILLFSARYLNDVWLFLFSICQNIINLNTKFSLIHRPTFLWIMLWLLQTLISPFILVSKYIE